jgi:hypothetical protein
MMRLIALLLRCHSERAAQRRIPVEWLSWFRIARRSERQTENAQTRCARTQKAAEETGDG